MRRRGGRRKVRVRDVGMGLGNVMVEEALKVVEWTTFDCNRSGRGYWGSRRARLGRGI
jgi:hypothetical protein